MPHIIAVFVFADFQLLDASGPVAAFEAANRLVPGSYDLRLVSLDGGLIASSSGVSLLTSSCQEAGEVDTLMAVGGWGVYSAAECERTLGWVRARSDTARRTTSVCSGAFLLGAAGVLDGRKATTHWNRSADFCRRFPQVRLEPDRIFVNDGPIWTSAGVSAGIDLALALITQDLGEAVARQVARQLVVYYRRPGGQSQFSELLDLAAPDSRFAPLLDHIRSHLRDPLQVEDLAHWMCMSPRHFSRLFTAEVGTTPARAVERLRFEAASSYLESGQDSIQVIAQRCGFQDAERMRRAFVRIKGMPPSAFRRKGGQVTGV